MGVARLVVCERKRLIIVLTMQKAPSKEYWKRALLAPKATMRRWRTVGASMETTSFLYSMGFVRPLSVKRPVYNLVRAIYFAEA